MWLLAKLNVGVGFLSSLRKPTAVFSTSALSYTAIITGKCVSNFTLVFSTWLP